MRRIVPGLASTHPLASLLPGMLADDEFVLRLLAGCDEVLAPVLSVLDNASAYVDPALAPADFLDWLGSWVGLPPGSTAAQVTSSLRLQGLRGTAAGLRAELALFGVDAEIEDPGGVAWSASAGGSATSWRPPGAAVVVRLPEVTPALRALVRDAVPAHLEVRMEQL